MRQLGYQQDIFSLSAEDFVSEYELKLGLQEHVPQSIRMSGSDRTLYVSRYTAKGTRLCQCYPY